MSLKQETQAIFDTALQGHFQQFIDWNNQEGVIGLLVLTAPLIPTITEIDDDLTLLDNATWKNAIYSSPRDLVIKLVAASQQINPANQFAHILDTPHLRFDRSCELTTSHLTAGEGDTSVAGGLQILSNGIMLSGTRIGQTLPAQNNQPTYQLLWMYALVVQTARSLTMAKEFYREAGFTGDLAVAIHLHNLDNPIGFFDPASSISYRRHALKLQNNYLNSIQKSVLDLDDASEVALELSGQLISEGLNGMWNINIPQRWSPF